MENLLAQLSEILLPHKDLIMQSAVGITIVQLLTPVLLVNDIRKAGSSKNFSVVPFLMGGIL
jgi:hypothetical protein